LKLAWRSMPSPSGSMVPNNATPEQQKR
jgi:hypothetical protein